MPSRKSLVKPLALVLTIAVSTAQIRPYDSPEMIEGDSLALMEEQVVIKKDLSNTNDLVLGRTPAFFMANVGNKIYVELHVPSRDTNNFWELKQDMTVKTHRWWLFSAMKKYVKFYEYSSALGDKIAAPILKALRLKDGSPYKGTIVIDEYNSGAPMQWSLETIKDFKNVKDYFVKNIGTQEVSSKNLLLLDINEDPYLTSLDADDRAFLDAYFVMPTGASYLALSEFFAQSKRYLRKTNSRVEGGKPELGFSNLPDHVTYYLEKELGREFNHLKYGPKLMKWATAAIALYITARVIKATTEHVQVADGSGYDTLRWLFAMDKKDKDKKDPLLKELKELVEALKEKKSGWWLS